MPRRTLRMVKPEIRIIGIDDGTFIPHSKMQVLVVGVVFRAGLWLEGVMSTHVTVDGLDATQKLGEMILMSPHFRQLRVIMINGLTLGGFNVVDIKTLHELTGLPTIAVTDKEPKLAEVKKALANLPNCEERWNAILNAGEIFSVVTSSGKEGSVYVEVAGISRDLTIEVLRLAATRSKIPEPLRVAHLVASAIKLF